METFSFSDVIGNFVICDRLRSSDRKHKRKGMWFGFQKPFVGRSVALRHKERLRRRLAS